MEGTASYFKYVIFFFAIFAGVPLAVILCRVYKPFMYLILIMAILSTTLKSYAEITFMHHSWYKTATWGFDVTVIDLSMLVIFFSMLLRPREYKINWFIPLTIPFALYFLAGVISWTLTADKEVPNPMQMGSEDHIFELWLFPLFELWKIVRFFFAIFVLTNFVGDPKATTAVRIGLILALLNVTGHALFERYYYKIHIVTAGMEHQHMFNAYAGMIATFLFPLVFYTRSIWKKMGILFLVFCALVDVILTLGRSAMMAIFAAISTTFSLVFIHNFSIRNLIIVLIFLVGALGFFIKATNTLMSRFNIEQIETSIAGRESLNKDAFEMAWDHPFGVGLGNYSAWFVVKYASAEDEDISIAHNIFYLNLGEVGFPGLLAFLLIYLRIYQMTFYDIVSCWSHPPLFVIVLGAFSAFLVLQIQDIFHFSSRQNILAFLMQIMVAYIARIYYDGKGMKDRYVSI